MLEPGEDAIPPYTRELLAHLDREYPHECIRADETLEQAHRRAGARTLIDQLLMWQKDSDDAAREDQD